MIAEAVWPWQRPRELVMRIAVAAKADVAIGSVWSFDGERNAANALRPNQRFGDGCGLADE